MIKRIILFVFSIATTTCLIARPVSRQEASTVGANFLKTITKDDVGKLHDQSALLPFTEFYLFTTDKGFVIVSGDDCVKPILAYSLTNRFNTSMMPINIRLWLQSYEDQIAYYKRINNNGFSAETTASLEEEWRKLRNGEMEYSSRKTIVGPLLSTTWNQSPYYNSLCPYDSDQDANAVTGCTATATAQVMKYWNHPTTGYGSHSYYHYSFGTLSANFGNTTYNWDAMPSSLNSSSSATQTEAVATLMYHVGVAVEMNYGVGGSGAATTSRGDITRASAENALVTYFKYSPLLHSVNMDDYTAAQWSALLRNELDNNRPIIYTGYDESAGHAFVCDGYNSSTGQFHINWGWGGWCDGFYTIGQLNPASGGTGGNSTYTFNLDNSAIIGIQPNSSWNNSTTVSAIANNTSYGTVTGSGTKQFGDTVTLKANANSGYRFTQWSDGYKYNPRQFIATGGNITLTAEFEAIAGDTISYCPGNTRITAFGTGNEYSDAYWGMKIPASSLTAGHDLNEVQLFIFRTGSYDLTIYAGSTSNSVYTASFYASTADEGTWKSIPLSSPVAIDATQPIWISFHNNGIAYPASLTYSSGNNDALLWGSSLGSIADSWNYSFMIRGIFLNNDTSVAYTTVNISCNGDGSGAIERNYDGLAGQLCGTTDNVPVGFSASYKLTPAIGSELKHFYVNNVDCVSSLQTLSDNVYKWTGTISDATAITAVFDLKRFQVAASSSDNSMGSVTGSGTYTYGSTATLTATPTNSNCSFSHWSDNSTANPYSFTVTSDVSLIAYFDRLEGIDATDSNTDISIYPNPTTKTATISLSGINGEISLQLVDAMGRIVISKTLVCDENCHATVNVENLARGIYFMRLSDGDMHNTIRRLVVK